MLLTLKQLIYLCLDDTTDLLDTSLPAEYTCLATPTNQMGSPKPGSSKVTRAKSAARPQVIIIYIIFNIKRMKEILSLQKLEVKYYFYSFFRELGLANGL